jgi:hypothetical protein
MAITHSQSGNAESKYLQELYGAIMEHHRRRGRPIPDWEQLYFLDYPCLSDVVIEQLQFNDDRLDYQKFFLSATHLTASQRAQALRKLQKYQPNEHHWMPQGEEDLILQGAPTWEEDIILEDASTWEEDIVLEDAYRWEEDIVLEDEEDIILEDASTWGNNANAYSAIKETLYSKSYPSGNLTAQ